MKTWPLIQQIRNFKKLRSQPETHDLAWPYLRSFIAYVGAMALCLPITLPLLVLVWVMETVGSAGTWINDNATIPGGNTLYRNYHNRQREAREAYAPFRNAE